MTQVVRLSGRTRHNWLIDVTLFLGALLALLTGMYFLYLPSGGFQGGRNAAYGFTLFFSRQTWDDLHTWGGVLMILAVVVHFAWHWEWVKMMARRVWRILSGDTINFSRGAKINVAVDLGVALGFLATAVSGIYLMFLPRGFQGGANPGWDPGLLFSRLTWDLIHTWGAVVMVIAAMLHFAIHWRWINNVTQRVWRSLMPIQKGSQ
jgi:hypothetical protein